MKLFDETESKYYELISYLLLQKKDFTGSDVEDLFSELIRGEKDFQTMDVLFSEQEGQEVLFSYENGKFKSIMGNGIPVRCNGIEQHAFRSLHRLQYADRFLNKETLSKIKNNEKSEKGSLAIENIEIKNRHNIAERKIINCSINTSEKSKEKLMIIAGAIMKRNSVIYDNVRDGIYEFRKAEAFPIKIEYSVLQDVFRVSAFEPVQNRFFMMTLDTMDNVCYGKNTRTDIPDLYEDFLRKNKKKVLLDVEPTGHVIERCFRIFSFYERRAVYDWEADKYSLQITYHSYDEAELIRDILSLGSSVMVIEPMRLREIVFKRIIAASRVFRRQNACGYFRREIFRVQKRLSA